MKELKTQEASLKVLLTIYQIRKQSHGTTGKYRVSNINIPNRKIKTSKKKQSSKSVNR